MISLLELWPARQHVRSRANRIHLASTAFEASKPDGTVVQNVYDVAGVLVRTVMTPAGGGAAVATDFVVDTSGGLSHIVAEVNGAGSVAAVYVRAGDMLLEEMRGGEARYFEAEGP